MMMNNIDIDFFSLINVSTIHFFLTAPSFNSKVNYWTKEVLSDLLRFQDRMSLIRYEQLADLVTIIALTEFDRVSKFDIRIFEQKN